MVPFPPFSYETLPFIGAVDHFISKHGGPTITMQSVGYESCHLDTRHGATCLLRLVGDPLPHAYVLFFSLAVYRVMIWCVNVLPALLLLLFCPKPLPKSTRTTDWNYNIIYWLFRAKYTSFAPVHVCVSVTVFCSCSFV